MTVKVHLFLLPNETFYTKNECHNRAEGVRAAFHLQCEPSHNRLREEKMEMDEELREHSQDDESH